MRSAAVVDLVGVDRDVPFRRHRRVLASGIQTRSDSRTFPAPTISATMDQRDDLGADRWDWLALVDDSQSENPPVAASAAKCAGVPDPVGVLGKHAAVSGVAIVTGELGDEIGTGAAVAEWMTGKVKLVELRRAGDGYDGTTTAFLSGFEHPVPVLRTSDGALLVGDWGTGKVVRVAATA